MGEEREGTGPLRPEYIRLIKMAIVAVIVIVALVIAIPFVQDTLRQPKIALTETSVPERSFCSQGRTFSFTLVNTGDADGFANIAFSLDGVVSAHQVYLVPAGSSIEKSFFLDPNDCFSHNASMEIEVSWKA